MKNTGEKEIKTRKIPKFGVLDAVIVLLVVIAIVGVYFRYNIVELVSNAKNLDNYTVSFSVENIRYTTPDFIDVGDEVYFAADNEKFGTLTNVSENMGALNITPASEMFTTSQGEIVEVFYPNSESRIDALGRLNCVGRYSDEGGFLVNGSTYVASGQYVNVKTEYITVTIRIDDIALSVEQ